MPKVTEEQVVELGLNPRRLRSRAQALTRLGTWASKSEHILSKTPGRHCELAWQAHGMQDAGGSTDGSVLRAPLLPRSLRSACVRPCSPPKCVECSGCLAPYGNKISASAVLKL